MRCVCLFVCFNFYLFERQSDRDGERENFFLLVHSPVGGNSQGWSRLNPGTWNSIWVFHMGAWAICCCVTRHISGELNWKQKSQARTSDDLTHCATTLALVFVF